MRRGQQRVDIGAHGVESDVAQIEQAGEADHDVQAERQEHEQDGEIGDAHPAGSHRCERERQPDQRDRDQRDADPLRSALAKIFTRQFASGYDEQILVRLRSCSSAVSHALVPSSPEGRNTSTAISTRKANTSW